MSAKPLEGIRVLTLEQFGAGPYGTMFLAELGAEVIKIEAPDGDPSRHVGPYMLGTDDSEYFQAWNLGKKSVTLDIKSAEGRRQFEALVKTADCVVNNLRGTQPAKLGIDYASLKHLKPVDRLPAHLGLWPRQRARGLAGLRLPDAGRGRADGADRRARRPADARRRVDDRQHERPHRHRRPAELPAARPHDRQGCDVETCLYDVAMHQLTYPGVWYLNEGDVSPRVPRSAHLSLAPVQTFPTAGRLDLHHVHDPEILAVARARRWAATSFWPIRASPIPTRAP